VPFAEERLLELCERPVERGVVPVEAAAPFCRAHEQGNEHAAVERARLVGRHSLVRTREDPRRRLALKVRDRMPYVVASEQPLGARLDEAAHERPVFVQRRPTVRTVLLECEGEIGSGLEILVERRERSEAEAAQRVVEVR
jgi:hypothetical protein